MIDYTVSEADTGTVCGRRWFKTGIEEPVSWFVDIWKKRLKLPHRGFLLFPQTIKMDTNIQ